MNNINLIKSYTNFDKMVRDMRDFILENDGKFIESSSYTFELKLVYVHPLTGTQFEISLLNFKKFLTEADEIKCKLITEAFKTLEGRKAFLDMINNVSDLIEADAIGNKR